MNKTLSVLMLALALGVTTSAARKNEAQQPSSPQADRQYWVELLYRIAEPVLSNMAEGRLVQNMQLELSPTWDGRDRRVAYMECFGRLMAGLAPWLALPDDDTPEGTMRSRLRSWALRSYANAVDPSSPDYLLWRKEGQTLVDAAYIAESFLRAPEALWQPLDSLTKARYIEEFTLLRRVDRATPTGFSSPRSTRPSSKAGAPPPTVCA